MARVMEQLPVEQLPEASWAFAAGQAVAEKTRVLGCAGKRLLVEVPDATWRTQLRAMAPQFLARINQFIRGVEPIERIEFQLAAGAEEEKPKRRSRTAS